MIEFTCDMCLDMMPLVHDGVASPDTADAVAEHLKTCPNCRALYEGQRPAMTDSAKMLNKIQKQSQIFSAMVLMFGILFGLMLTSGSGIFYNAIIMPIIGVIGYYIFRWRAVYTIPGLLLVTHLITNALGMGNEYLTIPSLLLWTGLYSFFALIGTAIAALLRFALKKEENDT